MCIHDFTTKFNLKNYKKMATYYIMKLVSYVDNYHQNNASFSDKIIMIIMQVVIKI